jgi:hypothetical protein
MIDADAFNGTYTKNPFNFKNYDIITMGLTVNGENLPGKPLRLKFGADSNYISAFQTLYAGAHKIFENQCNGITREEYANGYSLFVFDLTPDLCLGDHVLYNRLRTEMCQLNVDLEHRWRQLLISWCSVNFKVLSKLMRTGTCCVISTIEYELAADYEHSQE